MNLITDTWKSLVRRKLWPVALLLVAALAAAPFVLAKDPEVPPPAVASAAAKQDVAMPTTFVAATSDEDTAGKRRRVLGESKDPFEPAPLPKVKKSKKKKAATTKQADETTAPKDDASSPGSTGGATTPPVAPQPTATPTPTRTVPAFSVRVRFGTTDGEQPKAKSIERLSVLPDEENPLVVYRGVEDGGKVAIFELTGGIDAEGDGSCTPTPENCQYLKLQAGETEFFTVPSTDPAPADGAPAAADSPAADELQFQLDLVKIFKKATKEKVTDPDTTQSLAKAKSSTLASQGFELRRRNRYVFDPATGTLHRAVKGRSTPLSTL